MGREHDREQVVHLLRGSRLVTLTGPGGVGKTRLALEVAAAASDTFSDGIAFVDLAPIADASLVHRVVATALGVRQAKACPPSEALANALRHRAVLVVLDNCEQAIGACADLVSDLLRSCPGLRVLATSRERFGIDGESVWGVAPLDVPGPEEETLPGAVAVSNSVRLFCDRAASTDAGFVLSADNAAATAQICRRLEGVPLAIELAAARLDVLSPHDIADRLTRGYDFLGGQRRSAPPRHQSLEATVDWSYAALSDAERALLSRLSLFPGTFSFQAAEYVCSGGEVPGRDVFGLLARLVSSSLVSSTTAGVGVRFRLLDTVRRYASDKCGQARSVKNLQGRLASWSVQMLEACGPEPGVPQARKAWIAHLEAEHDNILLGLNWFMGEGDVDSMFAMVQALMPFWTDRGNYAEAHDWLESMLSLGNELATAVPAKALINMGLLATMLGDFTSATRLVEGSLATFEAEGDAVGTAYATSLLGFLLMWVRPEKGLVLLEEAASLAREAGSDVCESDALAALGRALMLRGDAGEARARFSQSLDLVGSAEDLDTIAPRVGLGWAAIALGDYAAAEAELDLALSIIGPTTADHDTAVALVHRGELCLLRAEYDEADGFLASALRMSRRIRTPYSTARALIALGDLARATDDPESARSFFNEAFSVASDGGLVYLIAPCLMGLGEYEAALAAAREWGDKAGIGRALHALGGAARTQGNESRSASLFHEALLVRHEIGDLAGIVDTLEAVAGLETSRHQVVAARVFGATGALRKLHGIERLGAARHRYEQDIAALGGRLPSDELSALLAEAAELSVSEVVAFATRGRGGRDRPREGWA